MTVLVLGHTATLLPNGLVLIAGGMERNGAIFGTAELYDPATGRLSCDYRVDEYTAGWAQRDAAGGRSSPAGRRLGQPGNSGER